MVAALNDVVSGLNEKRRGLHRLMDLAQQRQKGIVAVESKNRLAHFGFTYLESYLHTFGVRVFVMEHRVNDDPRTNREDFQQKLVEVLIAITTSLSSRIYGNAAENRWERPCDIRWPP